MGNEKDSKKRILASLVMGLNCVNSFAPMAVAVNMEQPAHIDTKPVKESVAEPEQYTAACYQALDVVDNVVFGTAEAFTENVNAGMTVIGETVDSTGSVSVQTVNTGGKASACIVSNGGTQTLNSGAQTYDTQISAGGTQIVNGGYAGGTVFNGGVQNIIAGECGGTINTGGVQNVSGGRALYVSLSGGVQNLSGGSAVFTSVFAGGVFNMFGGSANITQVNSGGVANVFDGKDENVYVFNGGVYNLSGGTALYNSISSGGIQNIIDGVQDYISFYGGTQNISGGTLTRVEFRLGGTMGSGGTQNVSGGTITSINIRAGGTQNVSGGTITSTNISSGGTQNVSGGTITSTNISSGGVQNISGGTARLNHVFNGAVQNVNNNGFVSTNYISGGTQNISGGSAVDNYIRSGGVQNVVGGTVTYNDFYYGVQNVNGGTVTNNQTYYGVQNVNGGTATYNNFYYAVQNVNGGTASCNNIGYSGTQNVSGGIAASNYIQYGGTQVVDGGIVKDTTVETGGIEILHAGDVKGTVLNGGITEVHNDAIDFGDLTMNDGIARFGADGGNYNITGNFAFNGGLVDLVSNPDGHNPNPRTYETLTIANLTGNDGIFKLDTDLDKAVAGSETTNGDKIVINSGVTGTHYIQVSDESLYTGTEITGDRKLLLVTDNSGVQDLVMEGKDLNNGGVWVTHAPTIFKEGNNWYIGYVQKEASNDTTVYLTDRQVAVYNQWTRISNDSLRKRLGDLRYNDAEAGVWARFYSGKLSGTGYEQNYHTYQVGFDKTNGNNTFGIALERQESNQSYTYGNGEGTTNAGNIYFTNYSDTGSFFDAILKYGKMNSKYSTIGTFPDGADYDTPAYSLSLEYGKTNTYKDGFFVEPKVQLTYGRVGSQTYTTNRGTTIEENAIKSLIGNVGFAAGRKVGDSDYYFKAGIFREFKGERDVHLAAANGENMYKSENYGDTWFELGLGGNVKLGKNTHVYGDVEKSFGADIQKKWQVNAGVRWEF